MKIAFTHNVQTSHDETQAEFDTPDTVAAITEALRGLGHVVEPIDVGGPLPQLIERLERFRPDLVFNTAEGTLGRCREAFYPNLFEQLGLAYTGSDAFACTTTLDKHLSKLIVAQHGVPTPAWRLIEHADDPLPDDIPYPLIVKPVAEGSSRGVTERSVVTDPDMLRERVHEWLGRYPTGVIIERFVAGTDVVVPLLEGAPNTHDGVLPASDYQIAPEIQSAMTYQIYDYRLKHEHPDSIWVRTPAPLDDDTMARILGHARTVFRVLNIRDLGRIDFRVTESGEIFFIEVNALPSLEPGASIYAAAACVGVDTMSGVLETIITHAAARHGLDLDAHAASVSSGVRVGLIYNLRRQPVQPGIADDTDAEFDSPQTLAAIEGALRALGHEVVRLEANATLPRQLDTSAIDVAFNIAEGFRGRSREAVVPALLELLNIPFSGSDAVTLAITLDKAVAKRMVQQAGVRTPHFCVWTSPDDPLPSSLEHFPLIIKPVAEGSSKGIQTSSVVHDLTTLRATARALMDRYRQGVLIEAFLPGREFTVGVLANPEPQVLPILEVVFAPAAGQHPVYSFDLKQDAGEAVTYAVPAPLTPALQAEIQSCALAVFNALGCRDVARVDMRLDAEGAVHFIECNPLPGLTPGWSDLCKIGEAAGMSYQDLIGAILAPALWRRQLMLAGEPS